MKKIVCLFLCVGLLLVFLSCSDDITNEDSITNGSTAQCEEDYFEWDGNFIVGLTDEGCGKSEVVIPARCEGFGGAIFAEKENDIEKVFFETNDDIDLNGVFTSAKGIKYVYLPEGLTKIANMDFWLCAALEEVEIPDSVTSIGEAAFQDCANLKKVVLGDNVVDVKGYAFEGCKSLKNIVFSDSVESIGEYAFYECSSLETITLPKSLKRIGAFAFSNCALEELLIPNEVVLDSYDTTSFVQTERTLKVIVKSGAWMDNNFESVFGNGYIKETY